MNRNVVYLPLMLVALCLVIASCGGSASPQPTPQPVVMGFTPQAVCRVPDVVGLDQALAEGLLAQLGLQPVKNLQYDATIAAGAVTAQRPASDTRLEPCQGDVDLVISQGEPPKPTGTPAPTNTPAPPTPTPTATLVPPTPTPTPDPRLFWDDFETGIRPDWNFLGNSYSVTNGKLVANGPIEGFIGDNSWKNYILLLNEFTYSGGIQYLIRVQDRDNYMMLDCKGVGSDWGNNHCHWYTVTDGEAVEIPGTHFVNAGCGGCGPGGGNPFRLEVEGNIYRTFISGEQILYFVDDTFQSGGIGLRSIGELAVGSVEVNAIP